PEPLGVRSGISKKDWDAARFVAAIVERRATMKKRVRRKLGGGMTRIDVGTVRTPWATFAVAATPPGIAAIFPVTGELTAARASRDPALRRRVRAGAELVVHRTPRTYPASLMRSV